MPRHVEGGPWVYFKMFKLGPFHGWLTYRSRLIKNKKKDRYLFWPVHTMSYWLDTPPEGTQSVMHGFRLLWVRVTVYRSSEWKIKLG